VLGRVGHSSLGAQIACKHLDKSSFVGTPEIFFQVLQAIAKGRRLTDGLRLAEALLKLETLSLAQLLIVPALMRGGVSLAASEREYLRYLSNRLLSGSKEVIGKTQLPALTTISPIISERREGLTAEPPLNTTGLRPGATRFIGNDITSGARSEVFSSG